MTAAATQPGRCGVLKTRSRRRGDVAVNPHQLALFAGEDYVRRVRVYSPGPGRTGGPAPLRARPAAPRARAGRRRRRRRSSSTAPTPASAGSPASTMRAAGTAVSPAYVSSRRRGDDPERRGGAQLLPRARGGATGGSDAGAGPRHEPPARPADRDRGRGRAEVFRTGNNDDWRRLCHWILSHDSLIACSRRLTDAQPSSPTAKTAEGTVLAISRMRSPHPRARRPRARLPRLAREHRGLGGRRQITDWDRGRYPSTRPRRQRGPATAPASFTPSLELRWRLGRRNERAGPRRGEHTPRAVELLQQGHGFFSRSHLRELDSSAAPSTQSSAARRRSFSGLLASLVRVEDYLRAPRGAHLPRRSRAPHRESAGRGEHEVMKPAHRPHPASRSLATRQIESRVMKPAPPEVPGGNRRSTT